MKKKKYQRLTLQERIIIETLLSEKKTRSFIATKLNRARSTITRELNKWITKPHHKYNAELAHWCAQDDYLNKRTLDKISTYLRLKIYVYRGLLNGWSPEQISGEIQLKYPNDPVMRISYEAIYMHIYRHRQARMNKKLIALLPYHKSARKSRKGFKKGRDRIKDAISIDERPKEVELRKEAGHWEGDLIIGTKQSSAIGTIVERKTRYTYIVKLTDRKSKTVTKMFAEELNQLSYNCRKSLTYDNGIEMANHKWLTKKTGMIVYFAHPYSSWERGTNENTNGLIRRFFPKGTDFNQVTEEQLKVVQDKLNNRPRKVLGFRTPAEMLQKEILNFC
jgi:transposase, IS30 family